jgi:CRP/FNR family cyclic AMP-dependent transcriptional regulator
VNRRWYEALPDEEWATLQRRLLPRRHRRGEAILTQGDPSANVYVLDAGHVAVRVATPSGDAITTAVLGPGDTFGELAQLSDDETRMASVMALDSVAVRIVPSRLFAELRARFAELDGALARQLAHQLRELSEHFAEATYETVQRRCGLRLLDLAGMFGDGTNAAIIPITQEDLAGLVGAARPTVNQVLSMLSGEGLVHVQRGQIELPDLTRLRRFLR